MKQLCTPLIIFIVTLCTIQAYAGDNRNVNTRRAQKVEDNIQFFETQVGDFANKYKTGTIWEEVQEESDLIKNSRYRFLKYPLMVPSYALRAATWPFALSASYLIKTGVVRDVVNLVSNKERTFWVYPKVEMGFSSSFGGGIGIKHFDLFDKNYVLTAFYQIHISMNQEAYASLQKDDAFGMLDKSVSFKTESGYLHHNDTAYYGRGPTSQRSNKRTFHLDDLKYGGWLGFNFTEALSLKWHTYFSWNHSYRQNGGNPQDNIAGYDANIHYIDFGVSLSHDTRVGDAAPEHGGLREIRFLRYQGLNTTTYDYNEYHFSALQYFRALMPKHVLVLRTAWNLEQPTDGDIPFYLLSTLDVNSPLRGFDVGRFRDRSSAVFNIEYRYPIWNFMDGTLFFDTGRVFNGLTDFSFKHFKCAGGTGLRIKANDYFLLQFLVGYGGENVQFLLKTSQTF